MNPKPALSNDNLYLTRNRLDLPHCDSFTLTGLRSTHTHPPPYMCIMAYWSAWKLRLHHIWNTLSIFTYHMWRRFCILPRSAHTTLLPLLIIIQAKTPHNQMKNHDMKSHYPILVLKEVRALHFRWVQHFTKQMLTVTYTIVTIWWLVRKICFNDGKNLIEHE